MAAQQEAALQIAGKIATEVLVISFAAAVVAVA